MEASEQGYQYILRKRKSSTQKNETIISNFLEQIQKCKNIVVFSGSGLSQSAGVSMFSTQNGLYQRACKKFKLHDGMQLFTYSFYEKHKAQVQAFFADIYLEVSKSQPAESHQALLDLHAKNRLLRHYTLNVDGLAHKVGLETQQFNNLKQKSTITNLNSGTNLLNNESEILDEEENHENGHMQAKKGTTVEIHGNIRFVVCPLCGLIIPMTTAFCSRIKRHQTIQCPQCNEADLRFKIMLYDDDEGQCITDDKIFDQMESDMGMADLILWVGISFEQSASVEYFRRVRHFLQQHKRADFVPQAIVNPSEDAYFNLLSVSFNSKQIPITDILASSDIFLNKLALQDEVKSDTEMQQSQSTEDNSIDYYQNNSNNKANSIDNYKDEQMASKVQKIASPDSSQKGVPPHTDIANSQNDIVIQQNQQPIQILPNEQSKQELENQQAQINSLFGGWQQQQQEIIKQQLQERQNDIQNPPDNNTSASQDGNIDQYNQNQQLQRQLDKLKDVIQQSSQDYDNTYQQQIHTQLNRQSTESLQRRGLDLRKPLGIEYSNEINKLQDQVINSIQTGPKDNFNSQHNSQQSRVQPIQYEQLIQNSFKTLQDQGKDEKSIQVYQQFNNALKNYLQNQQNMSNSIENQSEIEQVDLQASQNPVNVALGTIIAQQQATQDINQ